MKYSPEHKNTLINFDLKSFLETFSGKDIQKIKRLYPELYGLLADQIDVYPKAGKKLPSFTANYCFFTKKGFEQSTSETLAEFKASLFKGDLLIDLTGGLGADDAAFARSFLKVISVDSNRELNLITRINFDKLGIKNIERIDSTAEDFIKTAENADLIYLDPDRRTGNSRSVTLTDSVPPVPDMLNRLFELSDLVLLKLSPLIDLIYLKKNLSDIEKLYVISLQNEVKEILVQLKKGYSRDPEIIAVDLKPGMKQDLFSSFVHTDKETEGATSGEYFYEPAKCIIKAGLTEKYMVYVNLKKIGQVSPYMTGDRLINNFMGRVFYTKYCAVFTKSQFKRYIKDNSIQKANISRRDFPLTVEEIRKQYRIFDGGDEYLYFTTNAKGEKVFYHCRKLP
jgi:THUMP domain-like